MLVCSYCRKENPDDAKYCVQCGNHLSVADKEIKKSFIQKIPSWAWILLAVAAVIVLIGSIILMFTGVATVSGFASILFLIGGFFYFGLFRKSKPVFSKTMKVIMIGFFAFMGATVDQTGNYIYNKPVEKICCPQGTSLNRDVDVSNPLPGTTYIQQDYTCYDGNDVPVKRINMFAVVGIRFVEYMLLGYLLIWLRGIIWRVRRTE